MTEQPQFTTKDPRDRVIWSLRRTELAIQNLKDRQLRPIGIAAAHYTLLVSTAAEPGLTGAELARRLSVTPQAIASLVSRLEGRGLLERRTHPRHRQVQELHLTDAGRDALRQADEVMASIEQQVVDILGDAESTELRSVLDRLTETLRPEPS